MTSYNNSTLLILIIFIFSIPQKPQYKHLQIKASNYFIHKLYVIVTMLFHYPFNKSCFYCVSVHISEHNFNVIIKKNFLSILLSKSNKIFLNKARMKLLVLCFCTTRESI